MSKSRFPNKNTRLTNPRQQSRELTTQYYQREPSIPNIRLLQSKGEVNMYVTVFRKFPESRIKPQDLYRYIMQEIHLDLPSNLKNQRMKRSYTYTVQPGELEAPYISTSPVHRLWSVYVRDVEQRTDKYHTFQIPKSSGGMRTITAPCPELKDMQRKLVNFLRYYPGSLEILPHDAAYAYCDGRDSCRAMELHQKNKSKWFLKMDIKDFFPSFTEDLMRGLRQQVYPWHALSYPVWEIISQIVTHEGALPQGSPASPYLSNVLFKPYDYQLLRKLEELFKDFDDKFVYTRYADDLLISMRKKLTPQNLIKLEDAIKEILQPHFIIKDSKTRYGSSSGSNWNLGLMLNTHNNITIGYKNKRDLNAMLNNLFRSSAFLIPNSTRRGVIDPEVLANRNHILGKLAYLQKVEPGYSEYVIKKYERKYDITLKDVRQI
jgi:RNA-directed DNA polymerase